MSTYATNVVDDNVSCDPWEQLYNLLSGDSNTNAFFFNCGEHESASRYSMLCERINIEIHSLARIHARRALRTLHSLQVDDISQDVFMIIYDKWLCTTISPLKKTEGCRGFAKPSELRRYVQVVIRNTTVNHIRKQRRHEYL